MSRPPTGPVDLQGFSVLVPASADPAAGPSELQRALEAAGARVTAARLITIAPPADGTELDAAVRGWAAGRYAWIAFTSVSTVTVWSARLASLGLSVTSPAGAPSRIAAVGPATARAVRAAGWPVDLVPPTGGSGQELAVAWPPPPAEAISPSADADAPTVLLPRSDRAAPTLPQALTAAGHRVQTVTAYRTLVVAPDPAVAERLVTGGFAAALFTSPSTVQALGSLRPAAGTVLGAIGRPTADAVRAAGWRLDFTAATPTPAALVDGVRKLLSRSPGPLPPR